MNAPATTAPKVAPVIRTVSMSDGRKVDFVGKRRMQKSAVFDAIKGLISVRVDFEDGTTRAWDSKTVPAGIPKNVLDAACHGYEQKFGDECASLGVADSIVAIDGLITRFSTEAAPWNARGEGGTAAGAGAVIKALMELYSMDRQGVMAVYETFTIAEKRALRSDPDLKPIIDRIEAEENKVAKTDTKALLGKFTKPAQGGANSVFDAGDKAAEAAKPQAPATAAPAKAKVKA